MVATEGMDVDVETLGTKELAYHITMLDWDLFWAIHEYELLYHTFGRHHFGKVQRTRRRSSHSVLGLQLKVSSLLVCVSDNGQFGRVYSEI